MKKIISRLLSKAGYQVINKSKISFKAGDFQYELVTPYASYAPWLSDIEFQAIYKRIKENTLGDLYRCYELWELTEKVISIDASVSILEVGVWKGGTAGVIAKKLSLLKAKAPFYLADTFAGIVKASEKDQFYNGGEHADTSIEVVQTLMNAVGYPHYKILTGIFPNDTAFQIDPAEMFGLCHIDVDVYESAKDIVDWIWDRLIIGGMVVFDDYGFHTTMGVTEYVNEQKSMSDRIIIHNLNGHAVIVKIK
ncbi:TylF/MycF/NovP-related O-methyltransferase [Lacibacter sediminis]|uniref:Class I SAM-dependent methyltransferase n=1 Tax=Lacibacter sediminis TaxID=2760713 RepID=A0A7G5XLB8_9BACT|nr:TylF/MycF/NovP-related O-methyltransferase [Lacibacter sediminis]QNA46271.1 class I SAM-dependent methyltransferase [Lacibacter sediminis]